MEHVENRELDILDVKIIFRVVDMFKHSRQMVFSYGPPGD